MKKVRFLLLAALVAMFASCQKEETVEQGSGKDKPTPTGDTRIIIEGEGMTDVATRSSDGKVNFTGGYATGAGLYDGDAQPIVAAHPDAGYEVNYFYGGPENEPQKYNYTQAGTSTFKVPLGGQDHTFHCGFKEKKRELTVNAGTGGSVSPSGTNSYRVEKAISITATPGSGYEFSGWTVTSGDVTIENSGSPATTATLHGSNSIITAEFTQNGKFVAVGYNGYILTSMDGENWSAQQVGSNNWRGIAYGNGKSVAVGDYGNIAYSTDGVNWSMTTVGGDRCIWYGISYGNGKFVAVGDYGNITYSTDGVNWNIPPSISSTFRAVTYGNGKFVAVGDYGYIAYSTDGVNWSMTTVGGNVAFWNSITYGNGEFVVVGSVNIIAHSTDGTDWSTSSVRDIGVSLNGITYGNGKFMLVGDSGKIANSYDGYSWKLTQIRYINWYGISYGNGKFVAVGGSGNIAYSTDGFDWSTPQKIKDGNGKLIEVVLKDVLIIPNS